MHRRFLFVALVLVAAAAPFVATPAAAATDCSFPYTKTDATGTQVTIESDPQTVVTMNPSAAQTMYEIGAWDHVIGISTYGKYLPNSGSKTVIGSGWGTPSATQAMNLNPDLILVPNTISDDSVELMRKSDIPVYKFRQAEGLDDVVEKTRLTGRLVGECQAANERADEMEHDLEVIGDAVAGVSHPPVFYNPGSYTVGPGSFIHDVIQRAGARNIVSMNDSFSGLGTPGYFVVSAETVVAEDPAWFIHLTSSSNPQQVPAGPNGRYKQTTAYKRGNAVVLDQNHISQPAPRAIDALTTLVKAFHPERYRESVEGNLEHGGGNSIDDTKRVSTRTTASGATELRAQNLGRQRQVSFTVPRDEPSVRLTRLNVSLATLNPTFSLTVERGDAVETPPALNGTHAFERFELRKNGIYDSDIDHLTFRFEVNRTRLDARNASPENVTLYRHDGTSWSVLQTRHLGTANGTVTFEATSPGASVFVVGVPETAEAAAKTPTPTPVPTATQTPAPTATRTATPSTPSVSTDSTETTTTTPGFGVATALAALGAVCLWGRLR